MRVVPECVRQYVTDTELHGIKRVFEPHANLLHRLVWLAAFSACLVIFINHTISTCVSFFHYPYITNTFTNTTETITLPHIAICAIPMLPPITSIGKWDNMSHEDIIYFSNEVFLRKIMDQHKNGSLSLNGTALEHWEAALSKGGNKRNHSCTPIWKYRKNPGCVLSLFGGSLGSLSLFSEKLQQLQILNWTMSSSEYQSGIYIWIKKYGLQVDEHLAHCYYFSRDEEVDRCDEFNLNNIVYPRREEWSPVHSCLVVAGLSFDFSTSPYYNELELYLSKQLSHAETYVMLYTGSPNSFYNSISYAQAMRSIRRPVQIVTHLDLQRYKQQHSLDIPYHHTPCDIPSQPTVACFDQCVVAQYNCTWYFDPSLYYLFIRPGEPAPLCGINSSMIKRCSEMCPRSCHMDHHTFYSTYEMPGALTKQQGLIISANHLVLAEVFQETPAYEPIGILSDIGGLLGLFLGGSVLSIFHLLQVLGGVLGRALSRICCSVKPYPV